MSDLQTAFYIIGIIYMSLMFLLAIAAVVALFVIKSKINHVQRMVDKRMQVVRDIADRISTILRTAKYFLRG
jgi:uncharacterized protein YoxC